MKSLIRFYLTGLGVAAGIFSFIAIIVNSDLKEKSVPRWSINLTDL